MYSSLHRVGFSAEVDDTSDFAASGNFLGILCKKSPKKHVFLGFPSFFEIEIQNLLQMCSRGCF